MIGNLLKLVFLLPVLIPNCGASPVEDKFTVHSDEEIKLGNTSQQINSRSAENQELVDLSVNPALIPRQYEYLKPQLPSYSENVAPIQQYPQSTQQQYPGIQQSQYPEIQQSQYPGIQQSQYPGIQQSQYSGIQQYPGIQQPQYSGIQQSQYPGVQQYGYPEVPQGYPEVQQAYPPQPQQSVYPSNQFPGSLTCSFPMFRGNYDMCGLKSYPQYCRYKNPCVLNPGKYLKVIGNPQYFVQCDDNAGAYCKSCGPGTVWDQDLYTCNYPTAYNY